MSADIAAWVAEADFGTAPAVTAALHDAVDAGMLGYLPPAVRREMAAARQVLARRHLRLGRAAVARAAGRPRDAGVRHQAIARYTPPGSPVILPMPAYMPFVTAPAVWGREVLQVPLASDGGRPVLDLDALDAAFRAGGGLLVLVNPHNPTGRVLDRGPALRPSPRWSPATAGASSPDDSRPARVPRGVGTCPTRRCHRRRPPTR